MSHPPLFPMIPLTNVVIDNLHLFLRVSDVLFNQLIIELKRQDSIASTTTFQSTNLQRYRHLNEFQLFVTSLGIPDYKFYVCQSSKQLKSRSLTGPEKLKVMRHIRIARMLPNFADSDKIQFLWDELLHLNEIFSKKTEELTVEDTGTFEVRARTWCRKFIEIYHASNVTPYIHAMMNHVPEFMRLHHSIVPFTQQGLEKYNDVMTKQYFRATNHHDSKALTQIMEKQNRLEYLRDSGAQSKRCFDITCSKCGHKGHNRKTCDVDLEEYV